MAITQTTDQAHAATTMYELTARMALRSSVVFSTPMIAKVKPTNLTHRGATVDFPFYTDLATSVTPLTEDTDVTAAKVADTNKTVTITEYGQAVGHTRKLKGQHMLQFESDVAALNARAMADSFELIARNALMAAPGVIRPGDKAQNGLLATDTLAAHDVRKAVAQMRDDSVVPVAGDKYLAIISPMTSIDLREETGDAAWVTGRNYSALTGINDGEIGTFGGAVFYETNRVATLADAGDTNVDVYQNVVLGQEALACAYSTNTSGETPNVEISPVVDKLNRFFHIGWYWHGGFAAFRDEASVRIETASSIGANT